MPSIFGQDRQDGMQCWGEYHFVFATIAPDWWAVAPGNWRARRCNSAVISRASLNRKISAGTARMLLKHSQI